MQFRGTNVALVGHLVSCSQCKGVFPIVTGHPLYRLAGCPWRWKG
ncbi:hypothetical protein [Chania multitudinisentens]|nr:hypothetical protein [Chania multitudinisentens]